MDPLRTSLLSVLISVMSLLGCGRASDDHHDAQANPNTDTGNALASGSKLLALAEYQPISAVLVSDRIMSYDKGEFLRGILSTGVELWALTNDEDGGKKITDAVTAGDPNASAHVKLFSIPTNSVWMRDYGPLTVRSEASSGAVLLDQEYYPERPLDDAVPQRLAEALGETRASIDLANEGGNFLCDGVRCLMSERVIDANETTALSQADYDELGANLQKRYTDTFRTEIVKALPRMPNEPTGHVDMWAIFFDGNQVAVSELLPETVALASDKDKSFVLSVQTYLDDRADDLAMLGYQVERLPMPLPSRSLFRSYTNMLLVKGSLAAKAFVPKYTAPDRSQRLSYLRKSGSQLRSATTALAYADAALLPTYEAAVGGLLARHGFEPTFVAADDLIADGGAIHCVTMQVPSL